MAVKKTPAKTEKKVSYSAMIREALKKDPNLNQTELAAEIGCSPAQISAVKKSMSINLVPLVKTAPAAAPALSGSVISALETASELIKQTGGISNAINLLKKLEEMRK